ncbi:uncharacterized protein LOC134462358 [Engraulis encrasicolus]|uniref:uncharacterized protein LOC134462358 n=1 Tax=Engraulis encrasicolus TaxID=184585 RepID=UPI002FD71BE2
MTFPLYIVDHWDRPELMDFVANHFEELFNFDLGGIQVPQPLEEFSIPELFDIRTCFVSQMTRPEMNWATEKIVRCVAFMTTNVIVPALTICNSIEGTFTPGGRGWTTAIVPQCLPEQLDHLTAGDICLSEMPEEIPYRRNLRCRTMPPIQNGHGITVEGARSLARALVQSLAPGQTLWKRDSYQGTSDLFAALVKQRKHPTAIWLTQSVIAEYAGRLCQLRRKLAQAEEEVKDTTDVAAASPPLGFQRFAVLFISHFAMEASRILLECLANAPRAVWLQVMWPASPAEMLFYPQMFEPDRELKINLVLEQIYKRVSDFTALALEQTDNERVLRVLPFLGVDNEDTAPEVAEDVPVSSAVPQMQVSQAQTSGADSQLSGNSRRRRFSFRAFFHRNNRVMNALVPCPAVMEEHNSDSRRRPSLRSRVTSALKKLCCCCCRAEE